MLFQNIFLLVLLFFWHGGVSADGLLPHNFGYAPKSAAPEKISVLAATQIGERVLAVGDYGLITFSDDGGKTVRQAEVPTRAPLTAVFVWDKQNAWAVGHDGTILGSRNGGGKWELLRAKPGQDQVLMSVWFESAEHGFVVGQFGLVLETQDGGRTWKERTLVSGEAGEKHLQHIFTLKSGIWLVAAEAGAIFRSEDHGQHWTMIQTTNKGSFWSGLALPDGGALVGGMRGHIYRSDPKGLVWTKQDSHTEQSLTAMAFSPTRGIRMVGMSGIMLDSPWKNEDSNTPLSLTLSTRADRGHLHSLVRTAKGDILFGPKGWVRPE